MNYVCAYCAWSGPIPGKGRTCKQCGRPIQVSGPVCEHTGLPYRDLAPGENPGVRKYLNGQPDHYGMVFRNRIHVKDLYCPKCNKLTGQNAKLEGQFEHVCKNTLSREQGGKACRAKITYIFILDKMEERYD